MNKRKCPLGGDGTQDCTGCSGCKSYRSRQEKTDNYRLTPYEKLRSQVYATGNKWAIENFHATHD